MDCNQFIRIYINVTKIAVYLSLNGRFNFKKLVEEGTDEEKGGADKYFDYVFDQFIWDDKASGGDGAISILDWDGFSIRDYTSPAGNFII